jgi:hypothetical protein
MPSTTPRSSGNRRSRSTPQSEADTPLSDGDAHVTEPGDARDTAVSATGSTSATTLDEALAAWSGDAGRTWAGLGLQLAAAWLQGARAVREEQRAAAERAEAACLAAGQRLQSAADWQHAAAIQADLLREQLEDSVQTALRIGSLWRDNTLALAGQCAEGFVQAQASGFDNITRLAQVQAALPTTPEVLEAEAEHLTNPLAAGPLMWPAQEAMRQGMSMATSVWNDWVQTAQGSRIH